MSYNGEAVATKLNDQMKTLPAAERIELISKQFPHAVFTTSLGEEDQAITGLIAKEKLAIEIATLHTGRLFPETVDLIKQTKIQLGIDIKEYHPLEADIANYTSEYGRDGFYYSVEGRHACCHIRKIKPLQNALSKADAWVVGLRREQSQNRSEVPFAEWSEDYNLMKFNPLADWTRADLTVFIEQNDIPINPLHAKGFPSIGCEPCTRAIKPGEHERAGRWWWENEEKRECGLHVKQ